MVYIAYVSYLSCGLPLYDFIIGLYKLAFGYHKMIMLRNKVEPDILIMLPRLQRLNLEANYYLLLLACAYLKS